MSLRDTLQAIYDERGELTPSLVVDTARPDDHPLHDRFEWNDAIAGEAHRREQARRLIRSVRIVDNHDPKKPRHIRAFVSVARGNDTQPSYEPTEDAISNELAWRLVMQQMERDIAALKRKYGHMKEFRAAILAAVQGETA